MTAGNNFPFESIVDACTVFIDDCGGIGSTFVAAINDQSGGNGGGYVNIKGKEPVWVDALPYLFTSNDTSLFAVEEEVWQSRVYYYHLKNIKTTDGVWTAETLKSKVYPKAWLNIFHKYNLMIDLNEI